MAARPRAPGRVLALDVGEKRIGLAISDPSATLARPLEAIAHHPRPASLAAVRHLVGEHRIAIVVVGDPVNVDGSAGPQARAIRRYAAALAAELAIPVVCWDERFSTEQAQALLDLGAGSRDVNCSLGRARGRRIDLDAAAAAVILQSYLDARISGADRPTDQGCGTLEASRC
jgi:putative Holliday junction resolvase